LAASSLYAADPLMEDYTRAWVLVGQRRADDAIAQLKTIIERDPTFHRAYKTLVEAYHQQNGLDAAEQYFQGLVRQQGLNGFAEYGLAWVAYNRNRLTEVDDHAAACIKKNPRAVACYLTFVSRKQDELRQRLGLGPETPYACLVYGKLLRHRRAMSEARRVGHACLETARKTSDGDYLLAAFDQVGSAYALSNEGWDQALVYFRSAFDLAERLGDREQQFVQAINVIEALRTLGQFEAAISLGGRAVASAETLDERMMLPMIQISVANCYLAQGDMERALDTRWNAHRFLLDSGDTGQASNNLREIGDIYRQRGDLAEARHVYETAAEMLRGHPAAAFQIRQLALLEHDSGNYLRALQLGNEALQMFRNEAGRKHQEVATLANLAITHAALGDFSTALAYNEQALSDAEAVDDRAIEQRTLYQLGDLYLRMGDARGAIPYLERSAELSEKVKWPRQNISARLGLGAAYQRLGQRQRALLVLSEALANARQGSYAAHQADALSQIGQCHLNGNDLNQAEASFTESLTIASRAGFAEIIIRAHRGIAEIALRRRRYGESLDHLKAAVEVIETARLRVPTPDLRAGFVRENSQVYEDVIHVLSVLHDQNPSKGHDQEALTYAERARARTFLDLLAESKAQITKGLTQEQARQKRLLEAELSRAMRALIENETKKNRQAAHEAEQRLSQWIVRLRISNPKYHELHYPAPVDAVKARGTAGNERAAILEYALGERRSHLWVITGTHTRMIRLPPRSVIEQAVSAYRQTIVRRPEGPGFDAYRKQSLLLYELLLRPALAFIGSPQRLIIAPDGPLYYLPFETLLITEDHYLIEDHVIAYTPSVSVLSALKPDNQPSRPRTHDLLAYGDPLFSTATDDLNAHSTANVVRAIYQAGGIQFPPLPNTRVEVEAVASLFPVNRRKSYLGVQASETSVKREKLTAYRTLHFATHAVIDEKAPTRSGIVLSLVKTGEEDGILRMNEIFNLELNADLVVLSACQTGLGKVIRGEGMVGLTRAFLYAGSPRAVVSLWEVNDLTAPEIMKSFYLGLRQGRPAGVALREAKLEMIHSPARALRHPYFWAPFVLMGRF
jgi:CHAT domain-containing protein